MIQVNHENDWRFGRRKREKGSLGEDPPLLMESNVKNLISLPMSGRMPRNMSALAPC